MMPRSRQEYIDDARVIILEITRTDNWSRMGEVEDLIWGWNHDHPDDEIFCEECDDGIALEDEFFDLVDTDAQWEEWWKNPDKVG